MRVLVDTSVWVDFLNGHPSAHHAALSALIADEQDLCTCGVIVAEVFQGLRREDGFAELARDRDLERVLGSGLLRAKLLPVEARRSE